MSYTLTVTSPNAYTYTRTRINIHTYTHKRTHTHPQITLHKPTLGHKQTNEQKYSLHIHTQTHIQAAPVLGVRPREYIAPAAPQMHLSCTQPGTWIPALSCYTIKVKRK